MRWNPERSGRLGLLAAALVFWAAWISPTGAQGLTIQHENGSLTVNVLLQFRGVVAWADRSGPGDARDSWESGFEVRRTELELSGWLFQKDVSYTLNWVGPDSHGGLELQKAHLDWGFTEGWRLRVGQFKDRVFHEENVPREYQLAADRSVLNRLLGGGASEYVQGVAALHQGQNLSLYIAAHDGAASMNTAFVDAAPASDVAELTNFGISARGEWRIKGNWKDYSDFSARSTVQDMLIVGIGADWTQGRFSYGLAQVSGDRVLATADLACELGESKFSLFAAVLLDWTSFGSASVVDQRTNWGCLVQAAVMLSNEWEVFARYDLVRFDPDLIDPALSRWVSEITLGINHYLGKDGILGHKAKITFDLGFAPDGVPTALPKLGFPAASDGSCAYVRLQAQLLL